MDRVLRGQRLSWSRRAALLAVALLGLLPGRGWPQQVLERTAGDKPFADVVMDVELAITERNFRIINRSDIGHGIRERGYPQFPDALVVQFCSLGLAREGLDIDPHFIAYMPCRIAIDTRDGVAHVTTTLLPISGRDERANGYAQRVNALLRSIIELAVQ